ncbi:MAG: response regulator [Bryobacteraceae bacterium]|jgi:two-component system response regulator
MTKEKIILLVEDNPSDIALTRRALKRAGVVNPIVVAEDGQAALDYLLAGNGPRAGLDLPALVLLDLNLPRVSGLEVLERIRADQRTRRLPVVILTTSTEPVEVAKGYDRGVNSYIVKPIDFSRFADVVQHLGLYWLLLNEAPPGPDPAA